jgi:pyruvate/2-oxoglutarate dehydrogenase complex dihydrolipoamide acyltransferase (E2) component
VEGDRLVELLNNELTFDVPSPVTGRLIRILAGADRRVQPGMVLGKIAPDPDAA